MIQVIILWDHDDELFDLMVTNSDESPAIMESLRSILEAEADLPYAAYCHAPSDHDSFMTTLKDHLS